MNLSEMTHRITDVLKGMADTLTHRKNTQSQQPSSKNNAFDNRLRDE